MNNEQKRASTGGQQQIKTARRDDQKFLTDLSKRWTNEIGYIGQEAQGWYIDSGNVDLSIENGQHAGFLLSKLHAPSTPGVVPIFQAAICYDAMRRQHGLNLVQTLIRRAVAHQKSIVSLWCRADLDAMAFWIAAGFKPIAIRSGGKARNVPHICMRRQLNDAVPVVTLACKRRFNAGGVPLLLDGTFTVADALAVDAVERARDALAVALAADVDRSTASTNCSNALPANPSSDRRLRLAAADAAQGKMFTEVQHGMR